MPEILESAESASPLITRLVAGALAGRAEPGLELRAYERLGLRLLGPLPPRFSRAVAAWRVAGGAVAPQEAARASAEGLAGARVADYEALEQPFEVMFFGSALGGAAAHIAAAAGGPFLPQPFILGLRSGTDDDRLETYLSNVLPAAQSIIRVNPALAAIAHFDPIHDGWLTRSLSHLRLKLIDLPACYAGFIRRRLKPGGALVYLDCAARWLQYPLEERITLQVGGWGGIPAQEFVQGSPRIDRFLAAAGSSHRGGWALAGREPVWGPESEWGSQPGLDRALQAFAGQQGYRFERIRFEHPHDFSRLAFEAHRELYSLLGEAPRGVLVEMFTQYEPWTVLERRLLPLWLVFNTGDSLDFLRRARGSFPPGLPVYLSALVTLSCTPDMAAWDAWAQALQGCEWHSIGARREKYPEDLAALGTWLQRLRRLTTPLGPPQSRLPLDRLLALAASISGA